VPHGKNDHQLICVSAFSLAQMFSTFNCNHEPPGSTKPTFCGLAIPADGSAPRPRGGSQFERRLKVVEIRPHLAAVAFRAAAAGRGAGIGFGAWVAICGCPKWLICAGNAVCGEVSLSVHPRRGTAISCVSWIYITVHFSCVKLWYILIIVYFNINNTRFASSNLGLLSSVPIGNITRKRVC
jgi:hypothetical protein